MINSAAAKILEHRISGSVLRRFLILEETRLRKLDPQAIKKFLCFIRRYATGFKVCLVVGIKILVHAPGIIRRSVLFHKYTYLVKIERLHCLIESTCGICRDMAAIFSDAAKLGLAARILFFAGKTVGLGGISFG